MLTRNGWLVLALAVVTLVTGFALHYPELVEVGLAFALCLVVAVITVRTRVPVEVERVVTRRGSRRATGRRASSR